MLALTNPASGRQRRRLFGLLQNITVGGYEANPAFVDEEQEDLYLAQCRVLPASVLAALLSLKEKAGRWAAHAFLWQDALDWQTSEKTRFPLTIAKLLADRIISGELSSAQVVRLARAELREDWSDVSNVEFRIDRIGRTLRSPVIAPSAKAATISQLGFSEEKYKWALVENVLYQRSHSWPTLVLPVTPTETLDFSLPIGLQVKFDGHGTVLPAYGRDYRYFDIGSWLDSFQSAKNGARDVWLQQYGTVPSKAAEQVSGASVFIDTRIAEKIVQRFANWTNRHPHLAFRVTGRSAEALFALEILQQYIGSSAMQTTAATGSLGAFYPDNAGGDYSIEPPEHLTTKVRSVAQSHIHSRIIVPADLAQIPEFPTLSIRSATRLSDAANAAFGQVVRRHKYIRCPDLAAAFRPTRPADADAYEVGAVLRALRRNQGPRATPVVDLADRVKPESVVRALYRINDRVGRYRKVGRFADFGRFVVVRCVSDERNDRFWQLIWDQIGGSEWRFFDFQFRVDDYTAGQVLAEELGAAADLAEDIRPRPDILVLVGYERLFEEASIGSLNPFARLSLQTVLSAFSRAATGSQNQVIREQVGVTRVVLVQEQTAISRWTATADNTDERTLECLHRLSVFRFGFSEQMAADVLGVDHSTCREVLQHLTSPTMSGLRYASYADRPDEYFLLAHPDLRRVTHEERASAHLSAANSLVGFLAPGSSASNFSEALRPELVHEAQWHLSRTIAFAEALRRHGTSSVGSYWLAEAQDARERLSATAEPFGWSQLRWALRYSKSDREDLLWSLKAHFDARLKGRFSHAHPHELVLAARVAFKTEKQLQLRAEFHSRSQRERVDWEHLLKRADFACAKLNLSTAERRFSRFEVTLWRRLMRLAAGTAGLASPSVLADARFLHSELEAGLPYVTEEMYEAAGDLYSDGDGRNAAHVYELGLEGALFSRTGKFKERLVVKHIGAMAIHGFYASGWIVEELRRNAKTLARTVIPQRNGPMRLPHLSNRWEAGARVFSSIVRKQLARNEASLHRIAPRRS